MAEQSLGADSENSFALHQSSWASRTCPDEGNATQAAEPASSTYEDSSNPRVH